jgi:hypothetical protein
MLRIKLVGIPSVNLVINRFNEQVVKLLDAVKMSDGTH